MKKLFIAIIALAAAFAASGAVDPTNYTLNEPKKFSAAEGETNVYSGVISGSSYAIIEGGGTVAFSKPNNTYTGGTIVSKAVFRLDADGCAGVATITAAVNTAHIFLNCDNVPNDMYFAASYFRSDKFNPAVAYPRNAEASLYPLKSGVVVSGNISTYQLYHWLWAYSADGSTANPPNIVFEGDVSSRSGNYIFLYPYGTITFNGKYNSGYQKTTSLGGKSDAYGTIEFCSSSNVVTVAGFFNANISLKAVDALAQSVLYYQYGNSRNIMDINGHDQTFLGILWKTANPTTEDPNSFKIRSQEPNMATIRIKGFDPTDANKVESGATLVNRLALSGNLSLVMDVDADLTAKGFYQDFSLRKSDMTGDLIISNGDFRVSGSASFPNVRSIYIGTGGSFTNASTKPSAFAGCQNLTVLGNMASTGDAAPFTDGAVALALGVGAKFSLPAGATMTVCNLKVGSTDYTEGTFGDGGTPLDQILQGTVVVRSHDRYVDCVSGNDGNDGSEGSPYKTIKAATDNAVSGDVIHVAPGTYGEAEGSQMISESSTVGTRVVVLEGVTLESTGGAEKTFIVGAQATGDQIDNATYGTGSNAVRCIYAKEGSAVRGFTLTGGRGAGTWRGGRTNYVGAAFFSSSLLGATIEDCIVSNNAAYMGTIVDAVVRRCRVFGNWGGTSPSGAAGSECGWYDSIIDLNEGGGIVHNPQAFENCTVGAANVWAGGGANPSVLFGNAACTMAIVNSVILGGTFAVSDGAVLYCTNCLIASTLQEWANLPAERLYNTILTNSAAAQVDSGYRPILGSFVGIDAGDAAYATEALGDTDIYGTPRILNGAIDMGAVEHDWRPTFNAELGRRFKLDYVSPMVTTNATGGLLVPDGAVVGTVGMAGPYAIAFTLTGGSLSVYVGGELVETSDPLPGEQTIRFNVANADDEIRFVYVSEAGSTAVLKMFVSARGFTISFR